MGGVERKSVLLWAQRLFLIIGFIALGICAFIYTQKAIFQSYENWAFDRSLKGESASYFGYVAHWFHREETPPLSSKQQPEARKNRPMVPKGPLLGKLEIPRINVSAIVMEGDDSRTLRLAVGHIPGTGLPGGPGNFAIAGHRDTFFRSLKDIKKDDVIRFTTVGGSFDYVVDSIKVVSPRDTKVLNPTPTSTMTLVTCYPFYYVGHAPRRFIVVAREVPSSPQLPGS